MNVKVYKLILQAVVLIAICIVAKMGLFDKGSIQIIFGTIIGYAFATAKEAYVNKE
jgi:xanthine/uracil permease